MAKNNLAFKEAINVAAELSGISNHDGNYLAIKKETPQGIDKLKSDELEKKNKIISAKSIWNGTVDLKATLAEKYLTKHRGIDISGLSDMRYWPEGSKWKNYNDRGLLEEKINKMPALVIAAKNEKGDITGVQRVYLDKYTANKNNFMDNAKLSKGIIEGSCGVIQKGMCGSSLYIAEGPETAASIAMADRKATVLVSFGISNIKNLSSIIKGYKAKDIIIAADNDGQFSKTTSVIDMTIDTFKQINIQAKAIFPDAIHGKNKTDWNDVLLNKGIPEIHRQLFGNDTTDSNRVIEKPHDSSSLISYLDFGKLSKFEDIKIQSVRDSSITMNKGQQLNKLVESYNKNNTIERSHSFSVGKTAEVKINREVEMELKVIAVAVRIRVKMGHFTFKTGLKPLLHKGYRVFS